MRTRRNGSVTCRASCLVKEPSSVLLPHPRADGSVRPFLSLLRAPSSPRSRSRRSNQLTTCASIVIADDAIYAPSLRSSRVDGSENGIAPTGTSPDEQRLLVACIRRINLAAPRETRNNGTVSPRVSSAAGK